MAFEACCSEVLEHLEDVAHEASSRWTAPNVGLYSLLLGSDRAYMRCIRETTPAKIVSDWLGVMR